MNRAKKNDAVSSISPNFLSEAEIKKNYFGGRDGFRVFTPSAESARLQKEELEDVKQLVGSLIKKH